MQILVQHRSNDTEKNAEAAVTQVNGQPALVITPDTDPAKTNPAWVKLDLNGIDVNIFSESYSTDQLLTVAATLAQAAGTPTPSPSVNSSSPSPNPAG